MMNLLWVGAGGFLGAVARYGVSAFLFRPGPAAFPVGTLVVNVLGCLLIGVLLAERSLGEGARLFLVTGILGGFTTFSAFGHETVALLRNGATGVAAIYVVSSVVLGLGAVWVGRVALGWFRGA